MGPTGFDRIARATITHADYDAYVEAGINDIEMFLANETVETELEELTLAAA